jgi:hypothetical protein
MTRRTIETVGFLAALFLAAVAFNAWLASHDDRQRLQSTLATQKQIIDAADAREHARDTALNQTLAQIDKLKRVSQTPQQILHDLPKYLPLPEPITLLGASSSDGSSSFAPAPNSLNALPEAIHSGVIKACSALGKCESQPLTIDSSSTSPLISKKSGDVKNQPAAYNPWSPCAKNIDCFAQIPVTDLKPLYDNVQDCRASQAKLAAAKETNSENTAKIAALIRERDAAIKTAKHGTITNRLRHNAMWFAIGAATAYAASTHR